jgi:hypothetical protein
LKVREGYFLMNRRGALVTISLTALGGVVWSVTKPRLLLAEPAHAGFAPPDTSSKQALDDRLHQDLASRSQRINSEEGIAMFLVCENLVPDTSSQGSSKVALTPTNAALASAVHRNAEAWLRIRPDAQDKDVAELIEVLAYRDFANGGTSEE